MNRYDVLEILLAATKNDDLCVFTGEGLCREAFNFHKQRNMYLNNYDNVISIAIGMAMCSTQRVFIFCDDFYFLKNVSETIQAAVSRCKNFYIIILNSGTYSDDGCSPTIYNSIPAPRSLLFNMGFSVHDYKRQMTIMKDPSSEIKSTWDKVKGPLAVTMEVECDYINNISLDSTHQEAYAESIKKFLMKETV